MNKVIYLEPDEEIINVVDRLKGVREKNIALVIPEGAILISSAINLRLLLEEGKNLSKNIAIVTSDKTGRNVAAQLGFTVYESLSDSREIREKDIEEQERRFVPRKRLYNFDEDEGKVIDKELTDEDVDYTDLEKEDFQLHRKKVAQPDHEEEFYEDHDEEELYAKPLKKDRAYSRDEYEGISIGLPEKTQEKMAHSLYQKPKKNLFHKLIRDVKFWIYSVAAFLLLLALLVFVFPKATIYLNVYAHQEDLSMSFHLSTDATAYQKTDKMVLPATWESKDEEVSAETPATGKKNIGDKAKGTITVYNRSGKTVTIKQDTEFLTSDNKRFVITKDINVPGAMVSDFGELIPGTLSTDIEASAGGTEYNIKPSRFYVPALSDTVGNLVYGQTDNDTSGGTDKEITVVSKDDIDTVRQKAKDEASKKIADEFGMQGEKLYINGLGEASGVGQETLNQKEGDEADKVTITVKTSYSFLVFNKSDFDKMFNDSLSSFISSDKELVGTGYSNVTWQVQNFDDKKKEADVTAKATILTATKINEDFLKSKIITLNIPDLRTVLSQYADVELDHVSFFPPLLLSSIPSNERNITIVINHVQK